jgi:hypothetical protein
MQSHAQQKTRPVQLCNQGGKQLMPFGVKGSHGLGQASGVRSQIVWLRLEKYSCQSEKNGLL